MTAGSSRWCEQLISPLKRLLQKPWCKNGFNLSMQNNVPPPPKLVTTGKNIASCLANPCLTQGNSWPFRVQAYLSSSPGTWWNVFLTSPTLQFQTVLASSSQKAYIRPTALALTLMLSRWSLQLHSAQEEGQYPHGPSISAVIHAGPTSGEFLSKKNSCVFPLCWIGWTGTSSCRLLLQMAGRVERYP